MGLFQGKQNDKVIRGERLIVQFIDIQSGPKFPFCTWTAQR